MANFARLIGVRSEANAQTIYDQAENRLHAQKAILAWAMG